MNTQKNMNPKQKKIILETIRNHFNNNLFESNDFDTYIDQIIQKSNITVSNSQLNEYLQKYLHKNDQENKLFIDVNKRKIIRKNIIVDNSNNDNNLTDHNDDNTNNQNIIDDQNNNLDNNLDNNSESSKSSNPSTEELERRFNDILNQYAIEEPKYNLPQDIKYKVDLRNNPEYGPFGTQWIHDSQKDDYIDKDIEKRAKTLKYLMSLPFYDQVNEKDEWLKQRENKITASDIGCVLGVNKYESTYKFIVKKIEKSSFPGNKNTYHGKKFENIATMIYEYRKNVIIKEFGLIEHSKYKFLGASPDGIITEYKKDGKHKTKYVGRMIEIKCPQLRKINTEGEIIDGICPIYYWTQVQLQLECCDLDECDFWQCNIIEYFSRKDFLNDTDPKEPFRSKETGFEKGALIQLISKAKAKDTLDNYWDTVYNNTKFIYPEKIEMTPHELDIWILEKLEEMKYKKEYAEYYVDRIIYWRLNNSHCCTIPRDRKWFEDNLPTMKKIWSYVKFFKKNPDKYKMISNFIESLNIKKNDTIMNKIELICNQPTDNDKKKINSYKKKMDELVEETIKKQNNKIDKKKKTDECEYTDKENSFGTYLF